MALRRTRRTLRWTSRLGSPLLQAVQRLFYEAYFASRLLLYVSLCSSYAILLRGKTREIVGRAAKTNYGPGQ